MRDLPVIYIKSHSVWMHIHIHGGWFLSKSKNPDDASQHLSPREAGLTNENGGMQELLNLRKAFSEKPYSEELREVSFDKLLH